MLYMYILTKRFDSISYQKRTVNYMYMYITLVHLKKIESYNMGNKIVYTLPGYPLYIHVHVYIKNESCGFLNFCKLLVTPTNLFFLLCTFRVTCIHVHSSIKQFDSVSYLKTHFLFEKNTCKLFKKWSLDIFYALPSIYHIVIVTQLIVTCFSETGITR